MKKHKILRVFWLILGCFSLVFGILGIFLPLLPTTPFLLLSSALFLKSSKRLYLWLLNNKILGNYVYFYLRYRAIKLHTKIFSLLLLWVTITISIVILSNIYVTISLLIMALSVSFHLLRLRTLSKGDIKLGKSKKNEWILAQLEKYK